MKPISRPLWFAPFHVVGRYGYHVEEAPGNAFVGSLGDFREDQDAVGLLRQAIVHKAVTDGACIIGANIADLECVAGLWDRIVAVWVMECESIAGVCIRGASARRWLRRNGYAARPIIGTIKMGQILSPDFEVPAGIDWLAPEAYLEPPGPTTIQGARAAMRHLISEIMLRIPDSQKVALITQSYDRNGAWTNEATLAAIQRPILWAIRTYPNIKAILPFCWARPGGAKDHPGIAAWLGTIAGLIQKTPEIHV